MQKATYFLLTFLYCSLGQSQTNQDSLKKLKTPKDETNKANLLLHAGETCLLSQPNVEQERSRLAKDLHEGLGGILSGVKYPFTIQS